MSSYPEGVPHKVHDVAEALRTECLKHFGSTWNYDVSWALARAAIEAMREPSPGMASAGWAATYRSNLPWQSVWDPMMEAALRYPAPKPPRS